MSRVMQVYLVESLICSIYAILFLTVAMAFLTELEFGLKTYGSCFLDCVLNIAISFSLTFTVRLLLPFSGLLIVIVSFASSTVFLQLA